MNFSQIFMNNVHVFGFYKKKSKNFHFKNDIFIEVCFIKFSLGNILMRNHNKTIEFKYKKKS